MPLVQGGPPEWLWERPPDPLQWELRPVPAADGTAGYALRIHCGLEIVRLQSFSAEELRELARLLEAEAR